MNKYLCIPLFLCLCTCVRAWDFKRLNQYGDMIFYNILDESTCEVTSGGDDPEAMYYGSVTIPDYVVSDYNKDKEIELEVIGIGERAFYGQIYLQEIVLPENICYISDYAFYGCMSLGISQFPAGLFYIGEYAFSGPYNKDDKIYEAPGTYTLSIHKGIEEIAPHAFSHFYASEVIFEPGNKKLNKISDYAFNGCTMNLLYIKSPITTIGNSAFANCKHLTGIHMNDGVKILEEGAFNGHSTDMNIMELPATITDIGRNALGTLPKILYVNAKRPPYCAHVEALGPTTVNKKYQYEITTTRLVVPLKTNQEYLTTYPWDRFPETSVSARDVTGISTPTASNAVEESIFSTDGRKLGFMRQGVNIVRYKDGTTRKVYKR